MNRYLSILSGLSYGQAVQRLDIEYTAANDGGYPDCLKAGPEALRLATLKSLGFRVVRRFEIDVAMPGEPPDIQRWASLSGGISVDLTDGFVCCREGVS